MDESKSSKSLNELDPRSASDPTSAVVDAPPHDLAWSHSLAALERQYHSDPIKLCRNDLSSAASVVVYCGDGKDASQGFPVASSATGAAELEGHRTGKASRCEDEIVKAQASMPDAFRVLVAGMPNESRTLSLALHLSSNDAPRSCCEVDEYPNRFLLTRRNQMRYRLAPLYCRPWTLNGISPRLIESHYENNYGAVLNRLNRL
jgi:hypothetical protein